MLHNRKPNQQAGPMHLGIPLDGDCQNSYRGRDLEELTDEEVRRVRCAGATVYHRQTDGKEKVREYGGQCREPNRNKPPRSYDCTCPERCYQCCTKLQKNCLIHWCFALVDRLCHTDLNDTRLVVATSMKTRGFPVDVAFGQRLSAIFREFPPTGRDRRIRW